MIVARIDGGLGNQLFQVAFGMQLAHSNRTELVLDLSAYQSQPAHGYMLDRFGISARTLLPSEFRRLPARHQPACSKPLWSSWLTRERLKRIREKPFGFAPKYLRTRDNSYLVGYWQSERYFPDVATQVREQFRPLLPVSDETSRLYDRMLATPSVALHVRRGDYVTNRQAASIYRKLSSDYYRDCVMTRMSETSGVEAIIFSNDIAWCREHLDLPCAVHYVAHTSGSTAHEDLWLMSAAQCIVIANSTFSWWGAWLGRRDGHQVFAPRHWFYPGTLDDRHLACEGWRLIDNADFPTQAAPRRYAA